MEAMALGRRKGRTAAQARVNLNLLLLVSFIQGHVAVGCFRVLKSLSELLAPSQTPTKGMMTDGGKF